MIGTESSGDNYELVFGQVVALKVKVWQKLYRLFARLL